MLVIRRARALRYVAFEGLREWGSMWMVWVVLGMKNLLWIMYGFLLLFLWRTRRAWRDRFAPVLDTV